MTELARLAGVSRATVYNHFPTDEELFTACSTHWAARNPFPDPAAWAEIADPAERLGEAVAELYGWYTRKEDMLGNVFRDVAILPALATVMKGLWSGYVDAVVGTLAEGWPAEGAEREALEAALRLAVSFDTWRTLTEAGLESRRAAELATALVLGVSNGESPQASA